MILFQHKSTARAFALIICSASAAFPSQAQNVAPKGQFIAQKFDDWYYRCSGQPSDNCEVAQIAQVQNGGKNVSVLTLAIAPKSVGTGKKAKTALTLTALLPLNVFLPAGFSINRNGKPLAKLAYRNCNQAGCWAQQALEPRDISSLGGSESAEGVVRLMNGQDVNIRFSLKGLKQALEKLQSTKVN